MKSIDIGDIYEDQLVVVHEIEEHEDGSATFQLDIGAKALRVIVEVGLVTIFKEAIRKEENECS
jgi:hypothetical protein